MTLYGFTGFRPISRESTMFDSVAFVAKMILCSVLTIVCAVEILPFGMEAIAYSTDRGDVTSTVLSLAIVAITGLAIILVPLAVYSGIKGEIRHNRAMQHSAERRRIMDAAIAARSAQFASRSAN